MASRARTHRVLLGAATLLIASAVWIVATSDRAPQIDGIGPAAAPAKEHAEATAGVALAVDAAARPLGDSSDEVVARPNGSATAARREATEFASSAPSWSDLIVPVSNTEWLPVGETSLVVFTAAGERDDLVLASPVEPRHLLRGTIAVLVAEGFCPRAFAPADLAPRVAVPQEILLHPSTTIRVESDDAARGEVPLVRIELSPGPQSALAPWDRPAPDHVAELPGADVTAATSGLLQLLATPDVAERAGCIGSLHALAPTSRCNPLLTTDGAPQVRGFATHRREPTRSYPIVLEHVPADFHAQVTATLEGDTNENWRTDLRLSGDRSRFEPMQSQFVTGRTTSGEATVLRLRVRGISTLRARVPESAVEPRIGVLRLGEDGVWAAVGSDPPADGGQHEWIDIESGTYTFSAQWKSSGGAVVGMRERFELAPGESRDFGLLGPSGPVSLTVDARLVVDGLDADATFAESCEDLRWDVHLYATEGGVSVGPGPIANASGRALGDVLRFEGLDAALYVIVARASGDLPEAVAEGYCKSLSNYNRSEVELVAGSQSHTVEVRLQRASRLAVTVSLPEGFAGANQVRAYCVNADDETAHALRADEEATADERTTPNTFALSAIVPTGNWIVMARTEAGSTLDGERRFLVGRADVSLNGELQDPVHLALAPGASVAGSQKFFGASRLASERLRPTMLVPVGTSDRFGWLWQSWQSEGRPLEFHGLFPDTEYKVVGRDIVFRTGAPGSETSFEDKD